MSPIYISMSSYFIALRRDQFNASLLADIGKISDIECYYRVYFKVYIVQHQSYDSVYQT